MFAESVYLAWSLLFIRNEEKTPHKKTKHFVKEVTFFSTATQKSQFGEEEQYDFHKIIFPMSSLSVFPNHQDTLPFLLFNPHCLHLQIPTYYCSSCVPHSEMMSSSSYLLSLPETLSTHPSDDDVMTLKAWWWTTSTREPERMSLLGILCKAELHPCLYSVCSNADHPINSKRYLHFLQCKDFWNNYFLQTETIYTDKSSVSFCHRIHNQCWNPLNCCRINSYRAEQYDHIEMVFEFLCSISAWFPLIMTCQFYSSV